MIHTASRIQAFNEHFFAALETRSAQLRSIRRDIIRLDAGSPDLPPAPHIIDALTQSVSLPNAHGYQSYRGTTGLRSAWADMYRSSYGVDLDPEQQVLPLIGSKEGIFNLTLAFIEPGDVVMGPDPGYMTYQRATQFAGGEYYPLPLLADHYYLPDLHAIPSGVLKRARILWINYPHNPTSAIAPPEFLAEAVVFARRHNLLLCHDAAYTQVTFDGYQAPSLLSMADAKQIAVEFNSLSKSHNMAGWRLGAALGNPEALNAIFRVKANTDNGHFLPILNAAIAAMTGDQGWLAERNEIYRVRRDAVVKGLNKAGLNCAIPRASLYVWFSIPVGWTSAAFSTLLLEKGGVSLTPGTVFGKRGEGFMRVSLTDTLERIEEAMERIIYLVGGL